MSHRFYHTSLRTYFHDFSVIWKYNLKKNQTYKKIQHSPCFVLKLLFWSVIDVTCVAPLWKLTSSQQLAIENGFIATAQ